MSLSLPQLLGCLAAAQAQEVAPALAGLGAGTGGDANYAAGTATTTAMLLMLLAGEAATAAGREAGAAAAMRAQFGDVPEGRDARMAALGERLQAAEAAGERTAVRAVLALLAAEAEADFTALGLPLPPH